MIYFNLREGYLDGWSSTQRGHQFSKEVEDNHEVLINPEIFKYENGELVKDEEKQRRLLEERPDSESTEIDQLRKENEMNAMAILELSSFILGGE